MPPASVRRPVPAADLAASRSRRRPPLGRARHALADGDRATAGVHPAAAALPGRACCRAFDGRQHDSPPPCPPRAPFDADTRAWLNGLLAGLARRGPRLRACRRSPVRPSRRAGRAGADAVGVADRQRRGSRARLRRPAAEAGFAVDLVGMDGPAPTCRQPRAAPAADQQHLRRRRRPRQRRRVLGLPAPARRPRLDGRRYAVLAFGDSSYDRVLRARPPPRRPSRPSWARHGWPSAPTASPATTSRGRGWFGRRRDQRRDDGPSASARHPGTGAARVGSAATAPGRTARRPTPYARRSPLLTRLTINRLLGAAGSAKDVRQFGFATERRVQLPRPATRWASGRATAPTLVDEWLGRHRAWTANHRRPRRRRRPLREALHPASGDRQRHPGAAALRQRAGRRPRPEHPAARRQHRRAAAKWLWGRQAVDVLAEYPVRPPAGGLAGRCCSGCSRGCTRSRRSPLAHPRRGAASPSPRCGYGTARTAAQGRLLDVPRRRRSEHAEMPVFVQPTRTSGRPPTADADDHGRPGHRRRAVPRLPAGAPGARRTAAANWLFFGEQRRATDFYYADELAALHDDGC